MALARTAASYGARVLTRTRVLSLSGTGASVRDELTGDTATIRARTVINAAGVWAGGLVDGIRLRPSRGTHLVLRRSILPGDVAVMAPVPQQSNRFVFALPQPDGLVYVGLTDEPVCGDVARRPGALGGRDRLPARRHRRRRSPRRCRARPSSGPTPVSGRCSTSVPTRTGRPPTCRDGTRVLTSDDGVVTVVGGKLTTYRRMAQDALDRALARTSLPAGPCRTHDLPLVGAAPRATLAALDAPARLVRRHGAEAPAVLARARAHGWSDAEALAPVAEGVPTTRAELLWGVVAEGALDVDDLLDRRTRIGLVPADRVAAGPVAHEVLPR